jgi:uncharacterized protein (TIGR00369 family)
VSGAPPDPDFERRVRDSFARQTFMTTLGARLVQVTPGEVVLHLPWRAELGQQHGVLHAGVIASIADSACGYAALSLMPVGAAVMSVEFKVNLLAPAHGERIVVEGRVLRAGRTLTVSQADAHAHHDGRRTAIATMLGTMIRREIRDDARRADDADFLSLWAGQAAPLGRPLPAAELVRMLDLERRATPMHLR